MVVNDCLDGKLIRQTAAVTTRARQAGQGSVLVVRIRPKARTGKLELVQVSECLE